MLLNINSSCFYYKCTYKYVKDYFNYIVELIKDILSNNELNINIILGNYKYSFSNSKKTIIIKFNIEHTIIKSDSNINGVKSNTTYKNNKYIIRLITKELNNCDIIIDYSIPNICHVKSNYNFLNFSKKHIYISPSLYKFYNIKNNRDIDTLTTFVDESKLRRSVFLNEIKKTINNHINKNNCFNHIELLNIYQRSKILINIHQTNSHHTFEEFRVLPALRCGIIVISENCPLINVLPYNDYIIWCDYDDIISKVIEVLNNYDYYHNYIFNVPKKISLNNLEKINIDVLKTKIISLI